MTQCFSKPKQPSKTSTKNSLASLRSARAGLREDRRNSGSNFYVVDKDLYNAHLATEEDLIKVKEITANSVLLKPTAKDAYRVALKVFKRDYKKF